MNFLRILEIMKDFWCVFLLMQIFLTISVYTVDSVKINFAFQAPENFSFENYNFKVLNRILKRAAHLAPIKNVEILNFTNHPILPALHNDKNHTRFTQIYNLSMRRDNFHSNVLVNFFEFLKSPTTTPDVKQFSLTYHPQKNFSRVDVAQTEFSELNTIFSDYVSVTSMLLYNNSFTTLPLRIFDKNDNLQVIDLSWNLFENLPGGLFKNNKNLSTAIFRGERLLTTLPNGLFGNLPRLKIVNFDGCNLKTLPRNIFHGSHNLRSISFNKNNLQNLPEKIFDSLVNLETLDLADNQITTLPNNLFDSCGNLRKLYINNNKISQISNSVFKSLVSLKTLIMQKNHVGNIQDNAFSALLNVKEINLAHNNLTNFALSTLDNYSMSIFNNIPNLRKLDLSFNKVEKLFQDWIIHPPANFVYLNLSYNSISSLTGHDLYFQHKNHFNLDLSNNNITSVYNISKIPSNQESSRNVVLNIESNPIKCDCLLFDLLDVLEYAKANLFGALTIKTGSTKCSSSRGDKAVLLSDLKAGMYECRPPKTDFVNATLCPDKCDIWLRVKYGVVTFNCSNRNLTQAPGTLCSLKIPTYWSILDLSNNLITEFPNFQQIGYNRVSKLFLRNNLISNITKGVSSGNLEFLDVYDNQIEGLSTGVVKELRSQLKGGYFGNNPWSCDCGILAFLNLIKERRKYIDDVENITCFNSNITLAMLTNKDVCPADVNLKLAIVFTLFMFLSTVLIIIWITTCIRIKCAKQLKIFEAKISRRKYISPSNLHKNMLRQFHASDMMSPNNKSGKNTPLEVYNFSQKRLF